MNYLDILLSFLPELFLVVLALGIIGLGIAAEKGRLPSGIHRHLWIFAAGGVVVAGLLLFLPGGSPESAGGMLGTDTPTRAFKGILLLMSLLTLALTPARRDGSHTGEYLGLILFATTGLLLVVGSTDLLMLFLSLELVSLTLYILTGFDQTQPRSAEAALKYFLFGSVAAGFMLYGFSLIYGFAQTTNLAEMAVALASQPLEPLLVLGVVMLLAGFGFKVAAVPFHLWAPDVYQSAPLPTAALVAAGSKVAGFFILAKLLTVGLAGLEGSGAWGDFRSGWVPLLLVLAAFSMILGNLAALAQRTSVRRLLGYSAIAHGGYILLGLGAANESGVSAVLFYIVIYGLTAIGAFAVVGIVRNRRGGDRPEDFAGLSREMPGIAFCFLIFLISLAGIPPLAGFVGKFQLFLAALDSGGGLETGGGLLWLVALAIGLNAVSLYYYLLVLKQVYLAQPPETRRYGAIPVATAVWPVRAVVIVTTAAVVLGGLFPQQLLTLIGNY